MSVAVAVWVVVGGGGGVGGMVAVGGGGMVVVVVGVAVVQCLKRLGRKIAVFILLITSLVMLSPTEVKVHVLTERVEFKTWTACKEAEREVRAMGPQYQARCVGRP